jgi:hypothetical protein
MYGHVSVDETTGAITYDHAGSCLVTYYTPGHESGTTTVGYSRSTRFLQGDQRALAVTGSCPGVYQKLYPCSSRGTDSFTYTVLDDDGEPSNVATVTTTVTEDDTEG